jgi:hypothetical protein
MPFDPTSFVKPSPPRADANGTESGFERLQPLVTPDELRRQFLFGLRLKSTINQDELKDEDLQAIIIRAVSRVEHEAKIQISPVKFVEFHDYNLFDYQKWDFIQLNRWPIQTVESFRAQYPFTNQFIEFPTDWITVYNDTGIIQLVPKSGSFSQFLITRDASLLPLILGGRMRWPQLWEVTFLAGFELDKMPAIINELVGTYAAIDVLQMLDSIIFLGSYGIGIDGVSQSVGLPGPGFLQNRIAALNDKAAKLMDATKRFYNKNILISSF